MLSRVTDVENFILSIALKTLEYVLELVEKRVLAV